MQRLIDCIEAVAFDLDGTLIDTAPDMAAAANRMLLLLGGRPLPEHRIAALIGDGVDRFVANVLEESRGGPQRDPLLRSTAAALFRNLYEQRLFERGRIYPGIAQLLQALEDAALDVCCITNKESRFALRLLERAGLSERFAVTLCADDPEDRKPRPKMLLAACSELVIEPAQLLYVGDSPSDVAAARAAGCRVVAVNYGYNDPRVIAEARPDGLVGHTMEIVSIAERPQPLVSESRVPA